MSSPVADLATDGQELFNSRPDPDNPGWLTWNLPDTSRFNGQVLGPMLIRRKPDGKARTRMLPERRHTNLSDNIHGGTIMALVDVALFSTAHIYGIAHVGTAVTLDVSVQFIGPARAYTPLDSVAEVLKGTRRLAFIRGTVEQDGELVAAYSGTIRKSVA